MQKQRLPPYSYYSSRFCRPYTIPGCNLFRVSAGGAFKAEKTLNDKDLHLKINYRYIKYDK